MVDQRNSALRRGGGWGYIEIWGLGSGFSRSRRRGVWWFILNGWLDEALFCLRHRLVVRTVRIQRARAPFDGGHGVAYDVSVDTRRALELRN